MAVYNNEQITPREYAAWEHEKEVWRAQADHQYNMKQLEVKVLETEAKITSWFKIPLVILTLPVRILFVIPLTVYAVTHQEVPEFYQRFFR